MVQKYLEGIRQELFNRKNCILEQLNSLYSRQKEISKIVDILEEKNDPNYEAFCPRNYSSFDARKLTELTEENKQLIDDVSKLKDKLAEVDYRIDEVTNIIQVSRENTIKNDSLKDSYDSRIALLNSVEAERQRIARDLHDSTTQNLTALVHKTELCTKLLDSDPMRCRLELFSISSTLRDIIQEMRNMIYDLRPMAFDDMGFDTAVQQALDKFGKLHNLNCFFHSVNEPADMNHVAQITLLRVIQEACNNTVKYAEASQIDVTISYLENHVVLSIKDNGKGFDPDSVSKMDKPDHSGFGLSMMRERVYLLSGNIKIDSHPGMGCTIIVDVPISKED